MASKKRASKSSKKLSKKSLKSLFVVITLALLGLVYYRAQIKLTPQPIDIMEVGNVSTKIVDATISSTDNKIVNIVLNTNNAKVTAAQIELSYDSSVMGDPTITLGEFLPLKIGPSTAKNGLAKIVAAAPLESGGKAGTGTIATLTFPRAATSTTTLSITNLSMVAAVGYDSNVLNTTAKLTLTPSQAPLVEVTLPTSTTPPSTNINTPSSQAQQRSSTVNNQATTPNPPPTTKTLTPTNFGNTSSEDLSTIEDQDTYQDIEEQVTTNKPGIFARFLAWINLLFKSKNDTSEIE